MIPIWLIEADVFGRSFEPLKTEIRQQGMVWDIIEPRRFLNGLRPTVNGYELSDQECVVFSGTVPVMRHIQLHYPWVPGGWCTSGNFDCARYYPEFGAHLLNHTHELLTVEEALFQIDTLFSRFGLNGQVFIRPSGLLKLFTGRCVERDEFLGALESARYAHGSVVVARPREISWEWRVVVSQAGFIAASMYRLDGLHTESPDCPPAVRKFVDRVLVDCSYQPDPIYMMDVCQSGQDLFVLELNSFSCSGLYQCNPAAVVAEVKRLAIQQWDNR